MENMDVERDHDAEHSSSEIADQRHSNSTAEIAPGPVDSAAEIAAENVPGERKMNTGSYRKRKAKKQVGAEMTVEDLRGMGQRCMMIRARNCKSRNS